MTTSTHLRTLISSDGFISDGCNIPVAALGIRALGPRREAGWRPQPGLRTAGAGPFPGGVRAWLCSSWGSLRGEGAVEPSSGAWGTTDQSGQNRGQSSPWRYQVKKRECEKQLEVKIQDLRTVSGPVHTGKKSFPLCFPLMRFRNINVNAFSQCENASSFRNAVVFKACVALVLHKKVERIKPALYTNIQLRRRNQ